VIHANGCIYPENVTLARQIHFFFAWIFERKFIKRPRRTTKLHSCISKQYRKIFLIFLDNFCSFSQTHFLHCALIYMILITRLIAIFTHTICFSIKMEMFIFTKEIVITMTCILRKHMPLSSKSILCQFLFCIVHFV
jgi:hypothetical protein